MSPKAEPAPVFSPKIEEAFTQLQHAGLFGRTRAEVIERLVCDKLAELRAQGWWK